jgi:myo-inositol-1(or 4)-monophosphatase
LPNYGIVIAYTKNKIVQFAAAYDPSVDELFTAYIGKGAFLNGKKISVSKGDKKMIFNLSSAWKNQKRADELLTILSNFDLFRVRSSFAISLCHVACGRYDGIISLCKDSFPIFAGSLMIQEAGGVLTNERGDSIIDPIDRVFIGGNKQTYEKLLSLIT